MSAIDATLSAAGIAADGIESGLGMLLRIDAADVIPALTALRDGDVAFTFMVDLMATDTGEGLELTYHLRSFARDEECYLRCAVPYDGTVDSAWRVFPAALYPEREAAEMFGLAFEGHPNPKRLLTTDEVELPLLRKSTPIRTSEEVHDR